MAAGDAYHPVPTRGSFPGCERWPFYFPRRLWLVILLSTGMTLVYLIRVCLSTAIIPMAEEYGWDESTQGIVLSAFYWGYVLTNVPGGWLATKIGGRTVYGVGILWASLFSILTPLAAPVLLLLLLVRFTCGLGEAVSFPTSHELLSQWMPPSERSRAVPFVWGGADLGTIISMVLSPFIAEQFNWRWVFVVYACFTYLWAIGWYLLVDDTPAKHWHISQQERAYLMENSSRLSASAASESTALKQHARADLSTQTQSINFDTPELPAAVAAEEKIPWLRIFTSSACWALIIANFCSNWGFYVLLSYSPKWFSSELHFDLQSAGFLAALPYVAKYILAQIGGSVGDLMINRYHFSRTFTRKFFVGAGFLSPAVLLTLLGFVHNTPLAVSVMVAAVGLGGLSTIGWGCNHIDISPKYAGILCGIANTAGTIPGMIGVSISGLILQWTGSWAMVFIVAAAIYLFGAVVFLVFGTGERVID